MEDSRIRKLYFHLFHERPFSVTVLNGARLLQMVLDNSQVGAQIPWEMSVQTALAKQLCFHTMALMRRKLGRKKLNIARNAVNSTPAAMALQLV